MTKVVNAPGTPSLGTVGVEDALAALFRSPREGGQAEAAAAIVVMGTTAPAGALLAWATAIDVRLAEVRVAILAVVDALLVLAGIGRPATPVAARHRPLGRALLALLLPGRGLS
jgi:hypothetical protein